jgi:hypothetical protein
MEKWIVYVDEIDHGQQVLRPMIEAAGQRQPVQWLLVACPPRVTHHASKWVTHSARESWRGKWADKVFSQLVPLVKSAGDDVLTVMGKSNLMAQTESLMRTHGASRVLDARRPKFGQTLEPVTASQTPPAQGAMGMLTAVASAGLLVGID